jgi:hypothetical protein
MLVDLELIIWEKGYYYDDKNKKLGKITLTDLFITDILDLINIKDISIKPDLNVLILRDKTKNQIEFQHNKVIINMINEIQDYNKFMSKWDVRDYQGNKINTDLTRIFNEDFQHGGRLYTGAGGYQQIPSHLRKGITIDGERLVEIDIKGSHIAILYSLEGYILGKGYDPYSFDTISCIKVTYDALLCKEFIDTKYDPIRNLVKLALVVMINSKSRQSAIKALTNKVAKHNTESVGDYLGRLDDLPMESPAYNELMNELQSLKYAGIVVEDMSALLDIIEKRHKPISKYFYTGAGMIGQKLEGDIMQGALSYLQEAGIPALCIHDCLSVQKDYIEEATGGLHQWWANCIGDTNNLTLTHELY